MGWGKPSDDASGLSSVLKYVPDLPIIDNADCSEVFGEVGVDVVCVDGSSGEGGYGGRAPAPIYI